jgi:hypothetical protein
MSPDHSGWLGQRNLPVVRPMPQMWLGETRILTADTTVPANASPVVNTADVTTDEAADSTRTETATPTIDSGGDADAANGALVADDDASSMAEGSTLDAQPSGLLGNDTDVPGWNPHPA